ncbi:MULTISPECIES: MarR family winged helix-turn-helix transcriptional regulator [Mycolicibacterium]|uniref:Transcriptional regulator, MarR family n=1 Tax=Mycolicibacterium vanbaalenii (strain DSM 7251 / JCM 13017 / BCRC 16820 / KCTC 9966 / NRRL B-24157 / PYR-1) TaxID=350058 RepID=A1T2X2_MYCVP|nr:MULTISPECIES: MarR family winged helix-turn-helix transcriptional regulator [Mycolicibacterium]ABM11522.1 transcriptional regulator, MarR family [Mycolicibacterium vanbaalenii PYR-1]MCV7126692.1 winged helix-turn-helix transcriptional regulator [Mycolicibacterium vanbaalenii PYR-1]PQP41323.1 MarR family transcriptional regulator [Mycolicibacterium austroafricanum]QZT57508.1 MarR family winged helix-turn-helix transcriptional regulator [Mycolicibacterium austroafricanum]UJL29551.1 winged hel
MQDVDRVALEASIAVDVRALTAESDRIGHRFAGLHALTPNDFRALLHVMVAENAGTPLTAGELRNRMGTSGAAITYLVERMNASGHLRRESDPRDRRKVMLRVADHGMDVAREFFTPLSDHVHEGLAGLPDGDLAAAHRVFTALIDAMSTFRAALGADSGGSSGRLENR